MSSLVAVLLQLNKALDVYTSCLSRRKDQTSPVPQGEHAETWYYHEMHSPCYVCV